MNSLAHIILLRKAGASFEQFGEAVKPFFLLPLQELDAPRAAHEAAKAQAAANVS